MKENLKNDRYHFENNLCGEKLATLKNSNNSKLFLVIYVYFNTHLHAFGKTFSFLNKGFLNI